jgi:ABC-type iron transport system FetAB ATPase subunit
MLTVNALKRLHIGPVDFTIADGECVAVTGPSGSGKSVLLRAIADLDPNTGTLSTKTTQRAACPAPRWRKTVTMLPAESGWWGDYVKSHFKTPEKIRPLLTTIALDENALEWEVSRLSTGEKHRLALLRCLEHTPEVLLLDEPTAALDHDTTLKVEALFETLCAKGVSLLVVTHDPAQAERIAQRVLHLENGTLTERADQ